MKPSAKSSRNKKIALISCFVFILLIVVLADIFSLPISVFAGAVISGCFFALALYYRSKFLEARDEAETAKASLEIKIRARTRELKDLSENLENQVEERTKEFKEKVKELERFNKLAVGRELKMISLKEELKKFKEHGQ